MSGEKTEQPTDKRLRDSREKGDVAKSTEVVSAAGVLGAVAYFFIFGPSVLDRIQEVMSYILQNAPTMPYDQAFKSLGGLVLELFIGIVAPLVAIIMTCVVISLLIQVGFLFAPKAAVPKLENLSPKKWVKKVFSKKNVFEFVKNILKVVVLSVAVYMAVSKNFRELFKVPFSNISSAMEVSTAILKTLFISTIFAFAFIAAIDFLYTKFKYIKDHMMTKDEVKKEYKESEGDPLIKSKRKQLHREMLNQNTIAKTRKAKVLIVNPTHYAVAIDYEPENGKLPTVLAKGEGDLARRMIEVAKQEKIPIMREPPLARALFASAEEDQFVPEDLLLQVAEVLRFVQSLQDER